MTSAGCMMVGVGVGSKIRECRLDLGKLLTYLLTYLDFDSADVSVPRFAGFSLIT